LRVRFLRRGGGGGGGGTTANRRGTDFRWDLRGGITPGTGEMDGSTNSVPAG